MGCEIAGIDQLSCHGIESDKGFRPRQDDGNRASTRTLSPPIFIMRSVVGKRNSQNPLDKTRKDSSIGFKDVDVPSGLVVVSGEDHDSVGAGQTINRLLDLFMFSRPSSTPAVKIDSESHVDWNF